MGVKRIYFAVLFLGYVLWSLVASSIKVAYDVLTPGFRMKPGVVAIRLSDDTPLEITVLALAITLTPGTLTLDVSADRRVLFVHSMYVDDPGAFRREIKESLEQRILRFL